MEKRKAAENMEERRPESFEARLVQLFMLDVDVVSAARQLGSVDSYLDILDIFYTDGLKRVPLLKDLIQKGDRERYRIEVHGLKSAAGNIGANTLSSQARRHEESAFDPAFVEENQDALFDCYNRVLSEIGRVLQAQHYGHFAPRETGVLPDLAGEELIARLERAAQALADFQSKEAAREVEELLGHGLSEAARASLEHVRELLKLYEDDEAESRLRELARNVRETE